MTQRVRIMVVGLFFLVLVAGCSSATTFLDSISQEQRQEFSLEEYQAKRMELQQRLAEYEEKIRELSDLYE